MGSRRDILVETGEVLRSARRARGMTLRDVGTASGGRFKPTAVAGYERAERSISVERFCELCQLYDMAPERLLSQILWRIRGRPEPTIDRTKVDRLPVEERGALTDFIEEVRRLRGNSDGETITIRIQDLEVLATVTGHQLRDFLEDLRPALTADASRD